MNFPRFTVLLITSSLTLPCSAFLQVGKGNAPLSSSLSSPLLSKSKAKSLIQQKQKQNKREIITMMSSNDDFDEDDEPLSDELSKLIGKRASISSARKPAAVGSESESGTSTSASTSTSSTTIPSDNDENAIIDPSFEALYEGKTGMDIFEMPEFKTKRPLKTPKETEDKARGGDGGSGTGAGGSDAYIDYMAEYDDENDLHVPNRMGVSTDAWGDVDQGFKAGKKLKKKEIRAGKYLAGDLQVRFIFCSSVILCVYEYCLFLCVYVNVLFNELMQYIQIDRGELIGPGRKA